jgi:hypothetical protein
MCLIDGDGEWVDRLADLKSGGHYTINVADYSGFLTVQAQALNATGYIANQTKALELEDATGYLRTKLRLSSSRF